MAPALFALAMHEALLIAQRSLQEGEFIAAFLDDVYLVTMPARAKDAFSSTTEIITAHTGIRTNLGKCRMYNRTGHPPPDGVAALGNDVWRSDKPLEERGLLVLGSPIGSPEYVRRQAGERIAEERQRVRISRNIHPWEGV